MKKSVMTLLAVSVLFAAAERVEILSDRFEADDVKHVAKFLGHVRMKKGADELNASKVVVYFDAKRKPLRYEAIGKASFVIHMKKEGQLYTGKADKLVYLPKEQRYELYGSVVLKEPRLDRTVTGEKVVVEKLSGRASVEGGGDKPVKFIFKVEERDGGEDR
ncbi:lipopolysaccharide transport periplasmic protein LptA [Hydrogenimonas urashimensis]|uniref:lipopolysaccharide transport periplasmic protein LptA n=1 Tax=Hydrogenimonas urashimensis TaxID=2740515 RepID=UPI001916AC9E|nr:lipopolysaccharide transport periplasmic protein LptA [Hydrogenimonas urashimensis]